MSTKKILQSTKGFTLIELMIVIVIIGILATGAISVFSGSQAKTRDGVRQNDLKVISTALELFYTSNDKYPTTAAELTSAITASVNKIPKDPKNTGNFWYKYWSFKSPGGIDGQVYALATNLEMNDQAKPKENLSATAGAGCTSAIQDTVDGSLTCIYAVTSTNINSFEADNGAVTCDSAICDDANLSAQKIQ